MNWLDLLLGLVLVVSAFIGLKQGLIREVSHLAGIILGLIIASRTHQDVSYWLSEWLGEGLVVRVASFFLVFILVYAAAVLLGWILSQSIKFLHLGWMDKLLGVLFGAARGVLLVLLVLIGLLLILPSSRPNRTLRDSSIYRSLGGGVGVIAGLLPKSIRDEIRERDSIHRGGGERIRLEERKVRV